jgi:hypothetical protein
MAEEDIVEALQDRFGLDALSVIETAACHCLLPDLFMY